MADRVVHAEHLSKRYGQLEAVQDLCLSVGAGEVYGLLGPNGAGKTTAILMILGIVSPTSGVVATFGRLSPTAFESKRRIGVVPENQYFYEDMTAREFLEFFAEIYRVQHAHDRVNELLELVEMAAWADVRIKGYSHGMKQRLSIARALVHDPELLILDEPAQGLDPYGIRDIRRIIHGLHRAGKTIIMSSHILSEVEKSATHVGILHHGRLVAEGDVAELGSRLTREATIELRVQGPVATVAKGLQELQCVTLVAREGATLRLTADGSDEALTLISERVSSSGGTILGMKANVPTLEDAFFTLTEGNIGAIAEGLVA